MIIELAQKSTVVDHRADAALLVVDENGNDLTGVMKNWLDISQVIDMMATCKQLNDQTLMDFETESAHLYVATDKSAPKIIEQLLANCLSSDIGSINIPALPEIETLVWGLDIEGDLLVRVCG